MEIIIAGTLRPLAEGVHEPGDGDDLMPMEYVGEMRFSMPSRDKKTHFAFALGTASGQISIDVGRLDRDLDKPLMRILPESPGNLTPIQNSYALVFSLFVEKMMEDILVRAAESENFYAPQDFEYSFQIKDEAIALFDPIFGEDTIN